MRRDYIVLAGVSAASLTVGGAVGYAVANRTLKTKYDQLAHEEIVEAKRYYATLHKKDGFETAEMAAAALLPPTVSIEVAAVAPVLKDNRIVAYDQILTKAEYGTSSSKESHNVFAARDEGLEEPSDIVLDDEQENRQSGEPYVITVDEWGDGEFDWPQQNLAYFEGDDVLVDEKDDVVDDADKLVGIVNLTRFGHGSNDSNVVYIRNPQLEMEFEITRNWGEYAKQVLGFMEHSAKPRPRRFRGDDG